MSPSASITVRRTAKGDRRYEVRYRLGGRAHPVQHAGSFRTERDARERLRFVQAEIAAGRDPRVALRRLAEPDQAGTLDEWFGDFIEARVDVGDKTKALYRNARARLGTLAGRDVHTLAPADFQTWIADNADLAPKSLRHYLSSVQQTLDFADVDPNPARSPKVKLPTDETAEPVPPTTAEWTATRAQAGKRILLALRLVECCALRVSEAAELEFGDVDFTSGRLRISRSRTKRRTAGQRWIPVPPELLDLVDALVPVEDRHRGRRVFGVTHEQIRDGLARACRDAGVAHYTPHDLRHRRVSLWFAHGIDQITVKTWAGHARASMSSDTYGHVVVDAASDEWRAFWLDAYRRERLPKGAEPSARVVPVWSGETE